MNAFIAEFILRHASDAAELAQRAKVLAALTQLSPQRRNELAEAVNMVCRTIAAHGGRGKVRFSLVQHSGERFIEVSVCDQPGESQEPAETASRPDDSAGSGQWEAAVIQRVGELVDHFESSGWPVSGAVIRMAQALSPAFPIPTAAEVADWAQILKSNTALDALAYALRRARSLEMALGTARCQEQLRSGLGGTSSETEHFTMLSLVISKTKNAISIMEPDGSIIGINDAFVQMTGYTPTEAIKERFSDILFGPSTDPAAVLAYQRAVDNGEELTQDVMHYRKDGQTFWVESDLIPVRNAGGQLTRWILIQTDITKRHQTEETLRAAKETAEKNSRLKSEFLANLSHEIRTPMNAIIGMTDLTLATDLSDPQREYLQTVRNSSEALLDLLNDILDLSKIESGKMELEEVNFSLYEIVQEAIKTLAVKANEKGLELLSRLPEDLPRQLRGDPMKLRQILINLMGNAIKFTEQGEVCVTVQQQWQSADEIDVHFLVRDTGIGIPASKRDEIFEAFRQGDTSTTRRFGGSGLGLTISSELVRMMRGRIWVESEPGQGSVFHFTVRLKRGYPLALPAASSEPSASSTITATGTRHTADAANQDDWKAAPRVRPLHVLLADDHTANRHLVTTVLGSRGHLCVEASNGQEALEALRRDAFDVILMDVQMPVLDGFQATAAIRKSEETSRQHIPIIALTAHAMSGDRERCLAAGMDAYLAKPLRPKKLVELVESVADLKTRGRDTMSDDQSDDQNAGFDLKFALESLDHDTDLLVSQMRFFLHDAPVLLADIAAAIEREDARQLQLAAHRLKGMLSRYAFHDAVSMALQLEQKGQSGELAGARQLWQQLGPPVQRLESAIQRYVARHEESPT